MNTYIPEQFKTITPRDAGWNLALEPDRTEYLLKAEKRGRWGLIEVYKDGGVGYFTEDCMHVSDDCMSRVRADSLQDAVDHVHAFVFPEELKELNERMAREELARLEDYVDPVDDEDYDPFDGDYEAAMRSEEEE